jgi:hypothetical protein
MPGHHTISRASLVGASAAVLGLILVLPSASAQDVPGKASGTVAVGAQYDTTHVYVQHGTTKAFVASWEATFGGTNTTPVITDVTPTPSETLSELVLSPVGTLSVFDFQTAIPYPFGQERGGDLVSDFSEGVADAVHSGAYLVVSPWDDPIGKDAIVQFPGGVDMQLYWHTTAPSYAPLATIPESRVYLEPQAADAFIRDYLAFSRGRIALDDGGEIGLPGTTYRKILITSGFGQTLVIITNGHLPYPFGRESTGYAVTNLAATLTKAKAAGARILWGPYYGPDLDTAILQFPGGYIAEVHQLEA